MGNIPTEKKLELIRVMRSETQNNRIKMRGREQIVAANMGTGKMEERTAFSSLKFRVFAAILLFAAFVAWDSGFYPMFPENSGRLYSLIQENVLDVR